MTAPTSYTNRDFSTMLAELETLVKNTRPDLWSDFFESNLGVQFMELIALVGDIASFGQDVAALEIFLSTAQRYASGLRWANSVGYSPNAAFTAEGLVRLDPLTVLGDLDPNFVVQGGTIAAGETVEGENGLVYEVLEDYVIQPGFLAPDIQFSVYEGTSYEETFTPTTLPDQVVTMENAVVSEPAETGLGGWEVFVGATSNLDNKWSQVDRVVLEAADAKVFEVTVDIEGHLIVTFGDGITGKIPDDTITVRYRTTAAEGGNAPAQTVGGSVQVTIFGGFGTTSLAVKNYSEAATGGISRESLASMKTSIPAFLRSANRIITLQDYDEAVIQTAGIVLAFSELSRASYSGNVVKIKAWGNEIVDFTGESPASARTSVLDYTRFAQVPSARASNIHATLNGKTILTTQHVIERPGISYVDVYVSDVRYARTADVDVVHAALTQAVVGVFENGAGFKLPVSHLYDAVREVPNVNRFTLDRIVWQRLTPQPAVGSITLLSLPADGKTISIEDGTDPGNPVVFEFDTTSVVVPTNVTVPVGASVAATLLNLRNKIVSYLNVRIPVPVASEPLQLTNILGGVLGNVAITTTMMGGEGVVTGMTSGNDGDNPLMTDYRRDQNPSADAWPLGAYAVGSPYYLVDVPAIGSITLVNGGSGGGSVQPLDGETVTMRNFPTASDVIFEFDDDASVTLGNITVTIGATPVDTLVNLIVAINSQSGLDIQARDVTTGDVDLVCSLWNPVLAATLDATDYAVSTTGGTTTVTGMTSDPNLAWLTGGIADYEPIQDLIFPFAREAWNYYDESYYYNLEILYNSGLGVFISSQAITLRRLVFELVPDTA